MDKKVTKNGVWAELVTPHILEENAAFERHNADIGAEKGAEKGAESQKNVDLFLPAFKHPGAKLEEAHRLLQPSLRLVRITLRVMGGAPYTYDYSRFLYSAPVCSWPVIYSCLILFYMSSLVIVMSAGVISLLNGNLSLTGSKNIAAIKLVGIILAGECLVNAWAQLLASLAFSKRVSRLLNSWYSFVGTSELNPSKGLKRSTLQHMLFLTVFSSAMLTITIYGKPSAVREVLDGMALAILGLPQPSQIVEIVTCVMLLHLFAAYKTGLFSFMTSCALLTNGIVEWNKRLTNALEEIWGGGRAIGGYFSDLVITHHQLVSLVRETEAVFGAMLLCYYASSIITVCAELYLLASLLGYSAYSMEGVIAAGLILQTIAVFAEVSLAAARVYEAAESSIDILRRGIPYSASDHDKFHRNELITSVNGSSIHISGGKYFIINRPFILTVMSAVTTYFIVMLQFMLPHQSPATTTNTTTTATITTTTDDAIDNLSKPLIDNYFSTSPFNLTPDDFLTSETPPINLTEF